jgi:methionyl-tRNA formyltransferase
MKTVFLGMNDAGKDVLEWLRDNEEVDIEAVITDREGLEKIRDLEPEMVVSSGYEHIVPEDIIEIPERGIVNLHPSYLPYNRGAHPYIWPVVDDTPAGVSIHFMNENLDEGPLVARREVEVRPDDTAYSLRERLMDEQFELFKESWEKIKEGECTEQRPEYGNVHRSEELDELAELDLEEEKEVGEVIDILRALTYDGEGLARFERDGEEYTVEVSIEERSD